MLHEAGRPHWPRIPQRETLHPFTGLWSHLPLHLPIFLNSFYTALDGLSSHPGLSTTPCNTPCSGPANFPMPSPHMLFLVPSPTLQRLHCLDLPQPLGTLSFAILPGPSPLLASFSLQAPLFWPLLKSPWPLSPRFPLNLLTLLLQMTHNPHRADPPGYLLKTH